MTFRFSFRWHTPLIWIGAGLGVLAGLVALIAALAFFWFLPRLDDYRGEIGSLLSRALGQPLVIGQIDGDWSGLHPRLDLRDVRLLDARGATRLVLPRLSGQFGWSSLLRLEPRFHSLRLQAPELKVVRQTDGLWRLDNLLIDPKAPDTGLPDWLLSQPEVSVQIGRLSWQDDTRGAPPLQLNQVDLELGNFFRWHRLRLAVRPPAVLAAPLVIEGTLRGGRLAERERWSGTLRTAVSTGDLAAWAPWVDLPGVSAARGTAKLVLKIDAGRPVLAEASLKDAALTLRFDDARLPLAIRDLAGTLTWQYAEGQQSLQLDGVHFRGPGGRMAPLDARYAWRSGRNELTLDRLELAALAPYLVWLPPWAHAQTLAALAPTGRVEGLRLVLTGQGERRQLDYLAGRVFGLGWQSVGQIPGLRGLNGEFNSTAAGRGQYRLSMTRGAADLPFMRTPQIALERVLLSGEWARSGAGFTTEISRLQLSNADLALDLKGRYAWQPGSLGHINLSGRLPRVQARAAWRYLPRKVNDHVTHWVEHALLAGEARDAVFRLRGNLHDFPFRKPGSGQFLVRGQVRGITLAYARSWPQIENIDGVLAFHNAGLTIKGARGQIYGATLADVSATTDDLEAHDAVLEVRGKANGQLDEYVRFANTSPIAHRLDGLTGRMQGSGDVSLILGLNIPLHHSRDTTAAGQLGFAGNRLLAHAGLPELTGIQGALDFTERMVSARAIRVVMLGGETQLDVDSLPGGARVTVNGLARAAEIEAWRPVLAGKLSGEAPWTAQLDLVNGQTRLHVESSLLGLASALPLPLLKPAEGRLPMRFDAQMQADGERYDLQLGQILSARWATRAQPAGQVFERGELYFGGEAGLPSSPGLQISGRLRGLDLAAWREVLSAQAGPAMGMPARIDLRVENLIAMGRRFGPLQIKGEQRDDRLALHLDGQDVLGDLDFHTGPPGGAGRLRGRLDRLVIPDARVARRVRDQAEARPVTALEVPGLDLMVDDFRLGKLPLGQLTLLAQGESRNLRIERLQLAHSDSQLDMSGWWRDMGAGETDMKLTGTVRDIGALLTRLDYPGTVNRGRAEFSGRLRWAGSPADFSVRSVKGELNLTAEQGQFLRADPGIAKLLGVISLQSLQRRLSLDFRDVLNEGFAFDQISGSVQIGQGNLYSRDFDMKGPAARVQMSGQADIRDESVQLRIKVLPKLSEGVAVAGALLGGPVVGLGTFAVQKVFKDPIERASSLDYLVQGSWSAPQITRLARDGSPADSFSSRREPKG
jgi:uncharacterized protein (TIGR02099 family)